MQMAPYNNAVSLIALALPLSTHSCRVPHVCQISAGSPLSSSLSPIYRYAATFGEVTFLLALHRWCFTAIDAAYVVLIRMRDNAALWFWLI